MIFVEADTGTIGEAFATKFLDALGDCGVEIQKMRGQGYDGAAIMKGVQARIKQRCTGAYQTSSNSGSVHTLSCSSAESLHRTCMPYY